MRGTFSINTCTDNTNALLLNFRLTGGGNRLQYSVRNQVLKSYLNPDLSASASHLISECPKYLKCLYFLPSESEFYEVESNLDNLEAQLKELAQIDAPINITFNFFANGLILILGGSKGNRKVLLALKSKKIENVADSVKVKFVNCIGEGDADLHNYREYKYRYNFEIKPLLSEENKIKDLQIKEFLYNGVVSDDPDSMRIYNNAARPYRLQIEFQQDKNAYSVSYFLVDNNKLSTVFERFYGAHRDTNADFIIHMDVEKREYALSLFRQGLSEPMVIPKEAYQTIVFKNKFEDYRSDNYNQPRGAWIW